MRLIDLKPLPLIQPYGVASRPGVAQAGRPGLTFGAQSAPEAVAATPWYTGLKRRWQRLLQGLFKWLFKPLYAQNFVIKQHPIALANLPKAFAGFKIVQLTDMHFYPFLEPEYVARVKSAVDSLKPDCIVVTGDMVNTGSEYLPQAHAFFQSLSAPFGKWTCMGNHDYQDGQQGKGVEAMMAQAGFTMLKNAARPIDKDGARLWLSGIDDLKQGRPDVAKTIQDVDPKAPHLCLSHNPDLADDLSKSEKPPQLILSGHTHGGQLESKSLNWLRRLLTGMSIRYREGFYQPGKQTRLYVNSGTGSAMNLMGIQLPPLRYHTRPEITCFTLAAPDSVPA